jgi:hypothetical protein
MATAMGTTYNAASQLSFIPPKPDNVSESDYRRGRLMLENSYTQTNNAKNGIVAADYWNIAVAYLIMGQPKDTVYNFLVKSKTIDSSDFCRIALYANNSYGGIENTKF